MKFLEDYFKVENNVQISGLTDELNIFYILSIFNKATDNIIVLTSTLYEAKNIYEKIKTYKNDVLFFPMDDFVTSVSLAVSPELKVQRLQVLEELKSGKKQLVITNLTGYLRYLPNKEISKGLTLEIKIGDEIKHSELQEKLNELGYIRESMVSNTGEYAVRGFIIDIFLVGENHPIRIEFFGNKIESIRIFDENTQLSIDKIDSFSLKPYEEIQTETSSSLFEYLQNPIVIYYDYDQIELSNQKLQEEIFEYNSMENTENSERLFNFSDFNPTKQFFLNTFSDNLEKVESVKYDSQKITNFNANFQLLKEYVLKNYQNKIVIFYLSKDSQIRDIKELFAVDTINERTIEKNKINIIKREINEGFVFKEYIVISEYDIVKTSHVKAKYKNTYKMGTRVKNYSDLQKGDYVVHSLYGIGIYNGIITLKKGDMVKDYVQILYKDNDKIYIPVEKIDTLYKWTNKEGSKPKINKLGTTTWFKTKKAVRSKIIDITDDLIELYASRKKVQGQAFKDYPEMELFKNEFQYEETKDQTRAIKEVLRDLKESTPMDRLLCGDVGFGKTEIAFRAMFNTVLNNFQVAYLCPTTILSKQHYETAKERFKNFPIRIALVNRFVSTREINKIIENLALGKIDILIGTHRLLSDDIKFKNLGLLVIDEEQRFGVMHKEKIKQMKNDVNVLTLSATPIPRTMKFALAGLRDLSVIDTPPMNRYPIQTYVLKENDLLVKDAIYKELARDGQVFILYNNVSKIEDKMNELKYLIPLMDIRYAHGQMTKDALENIMQDFVDKKFNVLICTTIIETGIDIPNVNTLIIYDADRFGLSQLYQIRGRVGRSNKIAYAYLMYDPKKILSDIAIKRLQAIKEFTELGSGYKIAMRDLSLRGAGDLLGSEQAGFVDAVGIDMYLKMIEEEINRKKGIAIPEEEIKPPLIEVSTHISNDYVSDEDIKIEIHKKINEIDSYDKLIKVKEEIEDRFGKIDENMEIYMYQEWFEKIAKRLEINKITKNDYNIEIELNEKISSTIKGDKLLLLVNNISRNFSLKYQHEKIYISLRYKNLEKHFIYYLVKLFNQL